VAFKVKTTLDRGNGEDGSGLDYDADYETREFETEAEASAFIAGCDLASEATHGWTDGCLSAEKVD
jgi:hypothetical protein